MREYVVENEFVKAVRKAGGVAYKLTSQTANGLPDRLVLFFPAKTIFVELKAPGKQLRPLQRKRRYQLMKLGFPVLCIDRFSQIQPCIEAILNWTPENLFPRASGQRFLSLRWRSCRTIRRTWRIMGIPWNWRTLRYWRTFMSWTKSNQFMEVYVCLITRK